MSVKQIFKDQFTLGMIFLGIALVLFLPFGVANDWSISLVAFRWLCSTIGVKSILPACIEAWKLSAILWSLAYCLSYMLLKFPKAYPQDTRLGAYFAVGTVCLSFFVLWLYKKEDDVGLYKLGAELSVVIWFVVTDVLLAYVLKKVSRETKADYREFLWAIDFPGLLGFLILAAFLMVLRASASVVHGNANNFLAFVAGASAMNLIVINTAFAIFFLRHGGASKPSVGALSSVPMD